MEQPRFDHTAGTEGAQASGDSNADSYAQSYSYQQEGAGNGDGAPQYQQGGEDESHDGSGHNPLYGGGHEHHDYPSSSSSSTTSTSSSMKSPSSSDGYDYPRHEGERSEETRAACNLIINYIPSSVTDDSLRALFAPYGEIISCRIMKDKQTNLSLGYGFIEYKDPESAVQAIEAVNGKPIENKRLKVSYARPSSSDIQHANLYVSKLDPSVTKERLDELFSPFGTIIDSKILYDQATGLSRGVGFVRYDTRAQAEAAIAGLNGVQPEGCAQPIGVKFADTVEDKLNKRRRMMGGPYDQPPMPPYARGPGPAYGGYGGYSGYGGARYSPYGAPAGHYGAPPPAYGHDYYGDRGADPYYGGYGAGYGAPAAGGYGAPPPAAAAGGAGGQSYCLFVYNLPTTSDDGYLYRMFSPYGAVMSVKIVRDLATQMCKGYGFVHFMRLEDAQQAIVALNGYQIAPNKALQVSFKTPGKTAGSAVPGAVPGAVPPATGVAPPNPYAGGAMPPAY